jgi:molybdopterin adenylyltransferase
MTTVLKVAVLVCSDRSSVGEREDRSGPALADWLTGRSAAVLAVEIVPDERDIIAGRLRDWCDGGDVDVVVACGGTGVSPRDVTPEATADVVDRMLPGFGEAMRAASLRHSPHAMISRAVAGLRGGVLVIDVPGSPRAAVQNLEAVWSAVPHAVAKAQGDGEPCGDDGGGNP